MEKKLKTYKIETTSMILHFLAMFFMLCDHLWGTIIPGNEWLTCIGRIAFPIFAFMIVEGYFHTHNLKKYVMRMLIFAIISEIPFNLAMNGTVIYPLHQNVLWSFLLSIGLIFLNEKVKESKMWKRILVGFLTVVFGSLLGLLTMLDYYHAGILMVLTFYFFRGNKWWNYLGQFVCMWVINVQMLGGLGYEINLFGYDFFLTQQGLALLAFIPIWMYHGKQGPYNKAIKYIYYGFYPVHLLILGILRVVLF